MFNHTQNRSIQLSIVKIKEISKDIDKARESIDATNDLSLVGNNPQNRVILHANQLVKDTVKEYENITNLLANKTKQHKEQIDKIERIKINRDRVQQALFNLSVKMDRQTKKIDDLKNHLTKLSNRKQETVSSIQYYEKVLPVSTKNNHDSIIRLEQLQKIYHRVSALRRGCRLELKQAKKALPEKPLINYEALFANVQKGLKKNEKQNRTNKIIFKKIKALVQPSDELKLQILLEAIKKVPELEAKRKKMFKSGVIEKNGLSAELNIQEPNIHMNTGKKSNVDSEEIIIIENSEKPSAITPEHSDAIPKKNISLNKFNGLKKFVNKEISRLDKRNWNFYIPHRLNKGKWRLLYLFLPVLPFQLILPNIFWLLVKNKPAYKNYKMQRARMLNVLEQKIPEKLKLEDWNKRDLSDLPQSVQELQAKTQKAVKNFIASKKVYDERKLKVSHLECKLKAIQGQSKLFLDEMKSCDLAHVACRKKMSTQKNMLSKLKVYFDDISKHLRAEKNILEPELESLQKSYKQNTEEKMQAQGEMQGLLKQLHEEKKHMLKREKTIKSAESSLRQIGNKITQGLKQLFSALFDAKCKSNILSKLSEGTETKLDEIIKSNSAFGDVGNTSDNISTSASPLFRRT